MKKPGKTSAMRPEKKAVADELKDKITKSVFVILADYRGLKNVKVEDLRRRLRNAKASFQIVQNRLFQRVAKDLAIPAYDKKITGPSAMVFGQGDVAAVAKVLKTFIKENELPVIKIGTMGGVILTAADIEKMAGLPSREILLSMLVGTIAAPLSGLVGVLQQKAATVVYVLKAIQEKKEKAS